MYRSECSEIVQHSVYTRYINNIIVIMIKYVRKGVMVPTWVLDNNNVDWVRSRGTKTLIRICLTLNVYLCTGRFCLS